MTGVKVWTEPPDWSMAACLRAGADPDLFFVPDSKSDASQGYREAVDDCMRYCGPCLMRQTCLDYALTNGVTHGFWGGMTAKQRRKLLKQRRSHV
jgi:WhiB family transcriptional regulator, redox-sensing transcriptional regulator